MMYGMAFEGARMKRWQLRRKRGFDPVVAEAIAVLSDKELVWSDDFIDIRLSLAKLIQGAAKHPQTAKLAKDLSEQLVYGGEFNEEFINDLAIH